ncbi:hypothetical protein LUZ60_008490 [Juncus effusus]|nr:hypothetical protein LUZ60_008490 [Juncus effusus]
MGRAPCCDRATVKKGPWSPEEDELLRNYILKNGRVLNWIALPPKAGLRRCGKSCRLRWLNYLRPDIKHGGFTEEEDQTILALYSEIGSRWSIIASKMPGRTDNEIKNHWNTKLKKKIKSEKSSNLTQITPPLPLAIQRATQLRPYALLAGMYSDQELFTNEEPKVSMNELNNIAPQYSIFAPKIERSGLSVSDEVSSIASSSFSVENSLNLKSDEFFYTDYAFSYNGDLFFDEFYGFGEKIGEIPSTFLPNYLADLWVNSEVKAEGFFNSADF